MKPNNFGGVPTGVGGSGSGGGTGGSAGGDLSGTLPGPTVTGVDGIPLAAPGTEANGDTLVYNSGTGEWDFAPGGGGASPLTTKGDLYGYSTVDARVPVGTDGKVLTADSANALGVSWQPPATSSTELDYVQFTSNVNVSATTEGTANTIVTGTSITLDGATSVIIDFFTSQSRPAATASAQLIFVLLDGSTVLGTFGVQNSPATNNAYEPVFLSRRIPTPSAGSHQYIVKAYVTSGTGLVVGGAGGTGVNVPSFIRVTRIGSTASAAGTAFPGSPATGQQFFRTDLGLDCYYDGTRWLTKTLYREMLAANPGALSPWSTTGVQVGRFVPWHTTYDLWLVEFFAGMYVATTNSGSAFWTATLIKYQSNFSTTSTVTSVNTSADAANTAVTKRVALGALFTPGTYPVMQVEITKTSTPGALSYGAFAVTYRLVVT